MDLLLLVKAYTWTSIVIGVVYSAIIIALNTKLILSDEATSEEEEKFINPFVKKGHIQREVYDDRVVNYAKDFVGEKAVSTAERARRLKKENPRFYLLYLWLVGAIMTTVSWPMMLADYLTFFKNRQR